VKFKNGKILKGGVGYIEPNYISEEKIKDDKIISEYTLKYNKIK
jgi:hypothetical protein